MSLWTWWRRLHLDLAKLTRAHAFVVMLAYDIIKALAVQWQSLNVTVEEGIKEPSRSCAVSRCTWQVWPRLTKFLFRGIYPANCWKQRRYDSLVFCPPRVGL